MNYIVRIIEEYRVEADDEEAAVEIADSRRPCVSQADKEYIEVDWE